MDTTSVMNRLSPEQQAAYAAFMASMMPSAPAVTTPATQPVVVNTVATPAPPPINPSLAFRLAHWWDHSHQFRDTVRWWKRLLGIGKPPTPPSTPSGGSGNDGGIGGWLEKNTTFAGLFTIVIILGSTLVATMMMRTTDVTPNQSAENLLFLANQHDQNCLALIKAAGDAGVLPPANCSQGKLPPQQVATEGVYKGPSGLNTDCNAENIGNYTVYNDQKKGCSLHVVGFLNDPPRVKGNFKVTGLVGTWGVTISAMSCETYRYENGNQVNHKAGETNPFPCSQTSNFRDAPANASYTLTSY